jgi:hypothetical protein
MTACIFDFRVRGMSNPTRAARTLSAALGRVGEAHEAYLSALSTTTLEPERRLLEARLPGFKGPVTGRSPPVDFRRRARSRELQPVPPQRERWGFLVPPATSH